MFNNQFYHSLTRKYVIIFGACFNDITVRRFDANKSVIQNITIPITYAPKQKWVILEKENQLKSVSMQMPRLSFIITGIDADLQSERKHSSLNKLVAKSDKRNEFLNSFNQVPYKIRFDLFIVTKNHDDGYQIIEQILPYFQPTWTVPVKLIPELKRSWDIPITFTGSISQEETYDGEFKNRQIIVYTLGFEMEGWYLGPIQKSGIIKRINNNFFIPPSTGKVTADQIRDTKIAEKQIIRPGLTIDGEPTSDYSKSIPYDEIDWNNDFGFCIDIENL